MPIESSIQKLKSKIENGVVPAMATPLKDDGYHVNSSAVGPLVDFLISAGVKGLFVGGTTGEGILLTTGQRKLLHELAIEATGGRVPVLIHVGANRTDVTLELSHHAVAAGADAIVAVTPYYFPLDDNAQLAYFAAIAAVAPQTPLFAYDIPQMAVNGIGPALLARLADQIPSMAGIKSSRSDAQTIRQLLDATPEPLFLFAGNERVALGLLALGAAGLISGLATAVPEPFVALVNAFASGEAGEARRLQRLINQLLDLLPAGQRIGALKVILTQRGIPAGAAVPPWPTPPADWDIWRQIQAVMAISR